jgi:hypothetical protein
MATRTYQLKQISPKSSNLRQLHVELVSYHFLITNLEIRNAIWVTFRRSKKLSADFLFRFFPRDQFSIFFFLFLFFQNKICFRLKHKLWMKNLVYKSIRISNFCNCFKFNTNRYFGWLPRQHILLFFNESKFLEIMNSDFCE